MRSFPPAWRSAVRRLAAVLAICAFAMTACSAERLDPDDPTADGGAAEANTPGPVEEEPVSGGDSQYVWEVCYAPMSSADEIEALDGLTFTVLDAFPEQWTTNVPVPGSGEGPVCHQQFSTGGGDVWWIHYEDGPAAYEASVAWDAELVSAGGERVCTGPLEDGPDGYYSCQYNFPEKGFTAFLGTIGSDGPALGVNLLVQPTLP